MMNVKSVTEVDDAVVARVSEVLEFAFPGQKFEVLKVCDSGVYNMINVYCKMASESIAVWHSNRS
ncbi:hypothetical protein [Escherichia coli]|uniref:hypothetical protein n=1 Tax=Escherichia coli TaxID=562 RepID=UPI003CEB92F0